MALDGVEGKLRQADYKPFPHISSCKSTQAGEGSTNEHIYNEPICKSVLGSCHAPTLNNIHFSLFQLFLT